MIILKGEERLETNRLISLIGQILALVYVRVSTADQAKKGYSLDSQIEMCVKRAESYGIKESEIIVIVEPGGMGDDPNRPGLNNALFLLEKGLGKKLILLHPDRFCRDNTLQGMVSRKVWNLGVDLEFIEFEVDPNDPESMLMYNIQGSIAQYNKAKILANSKRGRIQKAKKGEIPSFNRLYGYSYNKVTDKLDVNEEEKEVYLEMVDMLLNQNMSCNQIAINLSKSGVKAPKGNVWYATTVTRILKNEDYKGIFHHGRTRVVQKQGVKNVIKTPEEEWIKIPIPRIIDDETYNQIQVKIEEWNKGKGRKSKDYLLKGLAKCGRCGSSAGSGITSKVKGGVYKYYACRKKSAKGYVVGTGINTHKCVGRNWRVDVVDEFVWKKLTKMMKNPKLIEEMLNNDSSSERYAQLIVKVKKAEKKLKDIDKEKTNYLILFGKGKMTEEKFDMLTKPLDESEEILNKEIADYKKEITSLEKKKDQVELFKQYTQRMIRTNESNEMSIEEKRTIAKFFIERVNLHEDASIEILWKFNFDKMKQNDDNPGVPTDLVAEYKFENRHKKLIDGQDDGLIFYVSSQYDLPEAKWMGGNYVYKHEEHSSELDKLCDLHFNKLVPFNKLSDESGIPKHIIEDLFDSNGIEKIPFKEIAKIKRAKDFDFIYDLHFNKKLSLNDIYDQYGFSPGYVKRVFEDKGLKHLQFKNQNDKLVTN